MASNPNACVKCGRPTTTIEAPGVGPVSRCEVCDEASPDDVELPSCACGRVYDGTGLAEPMEDGSEWTCGACLGGALPGGTPPDPLIPWVVNWLRNGPAAWAMGEREDGTVEGAPDWMHEHPDALSKLLESLAMCLENGTWGPRPPAASPSPSPPPEWNEESLGAAHADAWDAWRNNERGGEFHAFMANLILKSTHAPQSASPSVGDRDAKAELRASTGAMAHIEPVVGGFVVELRPGDCDAVFGSEGEAQRVIASTGTPTAEPGITAEERWAITECLDVIKYREDAESRRIRAALGTLSCLPEAQAPCPDTGYPCNQSCTVRCAKTGEDRAPREAALLRRAETAEWNLGLAQEAIAGWESDEQHAVEAGLRVDLERMEEAWRSEKNRADKLRRGWLDHGAPRVGEAPQDLGVWLAGEAGKAAATANRKRADGKHRDDAWFSGRSFALLQVIDKIGATPPAEPRPPVLPEGARVHDLKVWPDFYRHLLTGEKTFELRKDDRGYRAGHWLRLREWSKRDGYSGREMTREVTYLAAGIWMAPDHVAMALGPVLARTKGASAPTEPDTSHDDLIAQHYPHAGDRPSVDPPVEQPSDAQRYRAALQHIANGGLSPCLTFAQLILDGHTLLDAHRADCARADHGEYTLPDPPPFAPGAPAPLLVPPAAAWEHALSGLAKAGLITDVTAAAALLSVPAPKDGDTDVS